MLQLSGEQALATAASGEPRELLAALEPSAVLALHLHGRDRALGLVSTTPRSSSGARPPPRPPQSAAPGTTPSPPPPARPRRSSATSPAHDTAAAATMGQLRGLLRGIAIGTGAGPADVLRDLDGSMGLLRPSTLVKAAAARLEQAPRRDHGRHHPAAVVRRRAPASVVLSLADAVPVLDDGHHDVLPGVDPVGPRRERVTVLERGSTVLLYTDGLVERRDSDLDEDQARLTRCSTTWPGRPLPELGDSLVERMVDHHPDDDVALVAVRLHPQDRPRPASAGPADVPDVVPPDPADPDAWAAG
ncbi:PP2C family protein-serine/threonine phosphatase [Geodermatophilus sp. URMC 62]|uniref:PP2C family protein-serine/threonine phosphatase n=1 Tax=Geodermatophilus sp. URMC 62 TaxID=3423414 RepID=UPI00406CD7E7